MSSYLCFDVMELFLWVFYSTNRRTAESVPEMTRGVAKLMNTLKKSVFLCIVADILSEMGTEKIRQVQHVSLAVHLFVRDYLQIG